MQMNFNAAGFGNIRIKKSNAKKDNRKKKRNKNHFNKLNYSFYEWIVLHMKILQRIISLNVYDDGRDEEFFFRFFFY